MVLAAKVDCQISQPCFIGSFQVLFLQVWYGVAKEYSCSHFDTAPWSSNDVPVPWSPSPTQRVFPDPQEKLDGCSWAIPTGVMSSSVYSVVLQGWMVWSEKIKCSRMCQAEKSSTGWSSKPRTEKEEVAEFAPETYTWRTPWHSAGNIADGE